MITANNIFKERIIARDANKNGEYFCPACNQSLIVKQGEIKVWHFAHKYNGECWWPSQSEDHLSFKQELYDLYTSLGYTCTLEKIAEDKKSIIDLEVLNKKGDLIAIEVQLSKISAEKIIERTRLRSNQGYYTLWLLGGDAINLKYNKNSDEFDYTSDRTNQSMYLMHSRIYFGRVYTITSNFMKRAHLDLPNPKLEISVLYIKYATKTLIKSRHYLPIKEFDLLGIEVGDSKLKFARFYDKHLNKSEL